MSTLRTVALTTALLLCSATVRAQSPAGPDGGPAAPVVTPDGKVTLDFRQTDLQDVIESMATILKKRFVYDERVRGEITVISEEPITIDQAYRMFQSMLELKGFAIVQGPTGELKIIPARDAVVQNLPFRPGVKPDNTAEFITHQIKLKYVKVDSIQDTMRQLASKDAKLIADMRTNSLLVTDLSANIRRMINIVDAIDVATYEEQVKVIPLTFADAGDLTNQLREVFGSQGQQKGNIRQATAQAFAAARAVANGNNFEAGDAGGNFGGASGGSGEPRFIPDTRTNSIVVLAPQMVIDQVDRMVTLLDYKRPGRGKIRIYPLKNANAEDVAATLSGLGAGGGNGNQRRGGAGGGGLASSGSLASATRSSNFGGSALNRGGSGGGAINGISSAASAQDAVVTELEGGVKVTADSATNSLIIQSTPEAYAALVEVIEQLDERRPQVMIEGAMLEVNVKDNQSMGANFLYNTLFGGDTVGSFGSTPTPGANLNSMIPSAPGTFTSTLVRNTIEIVDPNGVTQTLPVITGVIALAQKNGDTNLISTPKILTADNEEAQIKVGETRGFPTQSLQAVNPSQGGGVFGNNNNNNFQTSTSIERQDVGVTMRITPQISEGDTVRMKIFTEISNVTEPDNRFGPTTSNRTIENTVYVKDGEAVMIGGIIQDQLDTTVNKVPLLGDIPGLKWAFRNEAKNIVKTNLIMILTPRIVRDPMDATQLTLEGREKFRNSSLRSLERTKTEEEERKKAEQAGLDLPVDPNPVRRELSGLTKAVPTDKLPALREEKQIREEARQQKLEEVSRAPGGNYLVQVALLDNPDDAAALLQKLIKSGYDGVVLSREDNGRTLHYVQLGPYPNEGDAQRIGREVKAETGFNTYVMIEP